MPALLLHMTLATQLVEQPAPGALAQAGRAAPDALLLGSVLPDLPYHGRFGRQLVRHFTGRSYLQSEWGDILHTRGTGQLALGLLRHLARSHLPQPERTRVLALAAGYLSHHAVDRTVHPVVNQMVHAAVQQNDPDPTIRIHERIERHQSLFYHRDLLGHDLVASPYPRQMVQRMAGSGLLRPALDPVLRDAFRAACLETHGRAPADRELSDWLRGTTTYGVLIASPLGRTERVPPAQWEHTRSRHYLGPRVDLLAPLHRAQQVTLAAFDAAHHLLQADHMTAEARQVFLHHVPDVDLGMGV